ncbi:hypothetical protein ACVPQV_23825 [Salmonella enterica subsp. enterica serovar Typhi]
MNYRSDAVLYLNHSHEYRMVDVDKAVRKALAEGKTATPTPTRSLPTRRCARNPIPPVIIKPTAPVTGHRP